MVNEAVANVRGGKTRISSYKGRAGEFEEADILTGEHSLLEVLQTVQAWTDPLRATVASSLAKVDRLLSEEITEPELVRLTRARSELNNMKDRLWLCLGCRTVGVAMLNSRPGRAKLEALFVDNHANLEAMGHYNFREARLHFFGRIEEGSDVSVDLLRELAKHASIATTKEYYANKLRGSLKRDMPISAFSEALCGGTTK